MKPYSESCDQNRDPILEVIQPLFQRQRSVLEIGSGTGQHAVYFAKKMPHVTWYTSDQTMYHAGIRTWLEEANFNNLRGPLLLEVCQKNWPNLAVDTIFSANTTHIMDWRAVQAFFSGVGKLLPKEGLFVLYGPFNYQGSYTSQSNENFDHWLKDRDPNSGIRHFEELQKLAEQAEMILQKDYPMPANNRILCWRKCSC